ncbi:type II toxin-antitoxin system VapC family toxin [Leptospira bandrabouensis]|uniref:type II toxin-antitoxin system VapC family toxin n=1 Tax=Leptospira bandrabouensis TaxID=2484903 RepID=UPI00223CDA81|nr:type II toxin-antitoxin system VapC family toxin [Leptospira bandrabouensis]MCW7457589.1 type II toxin-antitoxin system VapC family toxin [Leptospira bandrabouensis]MCW7479367.1 type II toxin-antitoxin system VapC family toxin [Leptospira bandrabouensis]MCW7487053.1 type II toxin-antitoxin system VapC family toxin [Leptospira bandrabouensis]
MNYLIDTHCILWCISDPEKLSKNVLKILENSSNRIIVSSLSLWEIALKIRLKKLEISGFKEENIPELLTKMNIEIMDFSGEEAILFSKFELLDHKDPFDLFLIYLSIKRNYTLISKDSVISKLKIKGFKTIW